MCLTTLFYKIDDFCQDFPSQTTSTPLLDDGIKHRKRAGRMHLSEMMTIVILFHVSQYRNFKSFYKREVCEHLAREFPSLLSYNRFVALKPRILEAMCAFLASKKAHSRGIAFIDSTPLAVCNNIRISRNKVFLGLAARGKSTTGWFYGFKLHLVVNDTGEILNCCVTRGNVDDRKVLNTVTKNLFGKVFADRGYISAKWTKELEERGLQLITSVRSNMKNKFVPMIDKILLRKRFIIETINDQLKNISQIEHSRHRNPINFAVNLIAGLAAYALKENKPSISWIHKELQHLTLTA